MATSGVRDRLERARAAGDLRVDVDTRVLATMIAGPVIQASMTGDAGKVDSAWIASVVSIVLDGARPRTGGSR